MRMAGLAILLLAMVSSGVGEAHADQKAAMEALQKIGAQFDLDLSNSDLPVIGVEISNPATTDADLAHLKEFPHLQSLTVAGKFTDAGLAHLAGLTELQTLELASAKMTDAGLAHLKPLVKLQVLRLHGLKVTDAGLVHLLPLEGLLTLDLRGAVPRPHRDQDHGRRLGPPEDPDRPADSPCSWNEGIGRGNP